MRDSYDDWSSERPERWSAAKWTAADGYMRCERGSERDPTHPFKQPRKNGSPPHF